jgi:predicted aspartyl protease
MFACRAALLLALLVAACAPTQGGFEAPGGCGFEPRADLSVELRRNVPLVHATVDGSPVTLILDTGAERSLLSDRAALRLGLPRGTGAPTQVTGLGAVGDAADATTRLVAFGGVSFAGRSVLVGTLAFPALGDVTPDGLLGADLLAHYDIDLDLPANRMVLYRARDCPETGPPWAAAGAVLQAQRSTRDHLIVPIRLNGIVLGATVDTGSEVTVLGTRAAARLGLAAPALARDIVIPVRGVTADGTMRIHRFGELRLGPLQFRRPLIAVAPLPDFVGDALLGIDVLRTRRVWLSWSSERMWLQTTR